MRLKFCSAAVDNWTEDKSKIKFMIMCLMYILVTNKAWVLKSKVLFCTPIKGASTGANLKEHLITTCASRGFPLELIADTPFVSDGGADIVLALSQAELERLYCFAHYYNVCLTNAFTLKVYKLDLFTPEAKQLIATAVKVAEVLLKHGWSFELPKGRSRGPFPSKVPLLTQLHRHFLQVKYRVFFFVPNISL